MRSVLEVLSEEIWNTKEAGEFLKRSPAAIRNLVLRRRIPYRKLAGRLIFLRNEIEEWIHEAPGLTFEDLKNGD